MLRHTPAAVALVSSLAITGCEMSYFAAEVETSEVCVVGMVVDFPGVPAQAPGGEIETTFDTALGEDDLGIELSDDFEVDFGVVSVLMAPSAGVDNFAFIDRLELAMSDQAEVQPGTVIVEFGAANMQPDGALFAEPATDIDITAYVEAGELVMDVTLAGDLPEQAWQATLDLCLSAGVSYVAPL